jgi:hypothetical protein
VNLARRRRFGAFSLTKWAFFAIVRVVFKKSQVAKIREDSQIENGVNSQDAHLEGHRPQEAYENGNGYEAELSTALNPEFAYEESASELDFNKELEKEVRRQQIDAELHHRIPEYIRAGEDFRTIETGAILSVDIQGSTALADKIEQKYLANPNEPQRNAAKEFQAKLSSIIHEIQNVAKLLGGKITDQLGDGTRIIFEGEDGAKKAAIAASLIHEATERLKEKAEEDERLATRLTLDAIDNDLIVFAIGSDKRRIYGLAGAAHSRAEALHKHADADAVFTVGEKAAAVLGITEGNVTEYAYDVEDFATLKKTPGELEAAANGHGYHTRHNGNGRAEMQFEASLISSKERNKTLYLADHPKEKEAFNSTFQNSTLAFVQIANFDRMVEKAANGDQSAKDALDEVAELITATEQEAGGEIRSPFDFGKVLLEFPGSSGKALALQYVKKLNDQLLSLGLSNKIIIGDGLTFGIQFDGRPTTIFQDSVNKMAAEVSAMPVDTVAIHKPSFRNFEHLVGESKPLAIKTKKSIQPLEVMVVEKLKKTDFKEKGGELAGRHKEIEALSLGYGEALAKQAPQIELVSGQGGLGKTAILSNFAEGKNVIASTTEELKRSEVYAPIKQLLENMIYVDPSKNRKLQLKTIVEKIGWEDAREADEVRNAIGSILGLPGIVMPESVTSLDNKEERIGEIIARLLSENPNAKGAVKVYYLEDLHFYDKSSLEVVKEALRRVTGPMQIVLTARNNELPKVEGAVQWLEELGTKENFDQVKVAAFPSYRFRTEQGTEQEVHQETAAMKEWWANEGKAVWAPYLQSIYPFDLKTVQRQHTVEKGAEEIEISTFDSIAFMRLAANVSHYSKGNPQIAKSIMSYLLFTKPVQGEFLTKTNEQGALESVSFGNTRITAERFKDIPDGAAVERERIDSMGMGDKEVAIRAHALGMRFRLSDLRATYDKDPGIALDHRIAANVNQGILRKLSEGDEFEFGHALTWQAAGTITGNEKFIQGLHEKLVTLYEKDPIRAMDLGLLYTHAKESGNLLLDLKYSGEYGKAMLKQGFSREAVEILLRPYQQVAQLVRKSDSTYVNVEIVKESLPVLESFRLALMAERKQAENLHLKPIDPTLQAIMLIEACAEAKEDVELADAKLFYQSILFSGLADAEVHIPESELIAIWQEHCSNPLMDLRKTKNIGRALARQGEVESAKKVMQSVVRYVLDKQATIFEEMDFDSADGLMLATIYHLRDIEFDMEKAYKLTHTLVNYCEKNAPPRDYIESLNLLATLEGKQDTESASQTYSKIVAQSRDTFRRATDLEVIAQFNQGVMSRKGLHFEEAAAEAIPALEYYRTNNPRYFSFIAVELARDYVHLGEHKLAEALINEASKADNGRATTAKAVLALGLLNKFAESPAEAMEDQGSMDALQALENPSALDLQMMHDVYLDYLGVLILRREDRKAEALYGELLRISREVLRDKVSEKEVTLRHDFYIQARNSNSLL